MRQLPQHRFARLLVAIFAASALFCRTGLAQDERAKQAKRAVLRLTALRAMVTRVHSDTALDLPPDYLVEAITSDLAQQRKPTDAAARTAVISASVAALQGWVESVAKEADPNGEHEVRSWLSQKMDAKLAGRKRSLREEFNARVSEDLKDTNSRLIPAYRAARVRVADSQVRKAVGKYAPGEEQIVEAAGDKAKERSLVEAVTAALAGGSLKDVLEEAQQKLQERASSVVGDGIGQFRKLLDETRGIQFTAHTPKGIRQELTEAARKIIQRRKADPLAAKGIVYDFLKSGADAWTKDEAAGRFQRKLAEELQSIEPSFPSDISAAMAKGIGASRRAHHKMSKSLAHFWAKQEEIARDRVASKYASDARKAKSRYDREEAISALPADVAGALNNEKAQCRPKWDALLQRWKQSLQAELSKVRERLAAEDAKQHCPDLVEGRWRPTAVELDASPLRNFGREPLKRLKKLWRMSPNADEDLLEETWKQLEDAAREQLRLGHEALAEQRTCVRELQDEVIRRMGAEKGRTPKQWREEYARVALARWRSRSSQKPEAVVAYPDLFDEVLERIRGIVDKALRVESPDGGTHVASGGPDGKATTATKPAGTTDLTGKGTGGAEKPTPAKPAGGDGARSVEELQNRIVDQVRPKTEDDVGKQIRAGKNLSFADTYAKFLKRVEELWQQKWQEDIGKYKVEDREVRPSVEQRIHGIVAKMLGVSTASLDAQIRKAQSALVKEHGPFIRDLILKEKEAGEIVAAREAQYRAKYTERVRDSWKKDALSKTRNYESLLPATLDEISGATTRLLDDIVKAESGPAVGGATPEAATRPAGGGEGAGGKKPGGPGGGRPLVGGIGEITPGGRGLALGSGMEYGRQPAARPTGSTGGRGLAPGSGTGYERQPAGWPTTGGWFLRSGLSLLLLIPALLVQLFVLWRHFRQRRGAGRLAASRGGRFSGNLDVAGMAMLRQMDIALECIESYRPSRPIATLDDLYAGAHELLAEILRRWQTTEDSRTLPELQIETRQLAFGGVLAAGLGGDFGGEDQ